MAGKGLRKELSSYQINFDNLTTLLVQKKTQVFQNRLAKPTIELGEIIPKLLPLLLTHDKDTRQEC